MSGAARKIAAQWLLAIALGVIGWLLVAGEGPLWRAQLLEAGYRVEAPHHLYWLLLIPALLGIRAHTRSDLPIFQQGLAWLLKSAAVALCVLSLIDIRAVRSEAEGVDVVFAVDVSESIPEATLDKARGVIEAMIAEAAALDEAERPRFRVVVFADEARELPLLMEDGALPRLPPWPRLPPRDGVPGTDIGAGLRLSLAIVPGGRQSRVVLMTDGHDTAGGLLAEGATLERFGTRLDYWEFEDLPPPRELMVTALEVPEGPLKPKTPFTVRATLRATVPMAVRCAITLVDDPNKDAPPLASETLTLAAGVVEHPFELRVDRGGEQRLELRCDPERPEDDAFEDNNRVSMPVTLEDKPRVLYVEGEDRQRHALLSALSGEFDVEVRGPRGTPRSLPEAEGFDLILISDVPRLGEGGLENMSTAQMRVLERYVRGGGALVMTGGADSFGPGGYGQTALERDVLPVRLDVQRRQETPELALVLLIDRSGSMSGPRIELARKAAVETLNALQPSDLLGVLAFDTRVTELVPLQRAANRFRITDAIQRLKPGGGTNILIGLDAAYRALMRVDAKVKHVILITDGQSNRAGIVELATQASLDRITISTVAVGSGSDTQILRKIASAARGRYYFTSNPLQLPQLLLKETSEVTRKAVVDARFQPRVNPRFRGLQMFGGIDLGAAPSLLGYVSTRAKPAAEVLMTTHRNEPLLARWRLGLGRVVVWTSDVKNRWSHLWLRWPGYAKFWRQLVRDHARHEPPEPLTSLEATIEGRELVVSLDAIDAEDRFVDGLIHAVTVTAPDGQSHPLPLRPVAAGRYEGRHRLETFGPYTITGDHRLAGSDPDDLAFKSRGLASWPFPDELLVGEPDLTEVRALSGATGGIRNPSPSVWQESAEDHTIHERPLWPIFPPWALLAVVLDVMLRRIRLGSVS